MNCDQVFDVLTRGPFPTGTPCDTPVEAHLRVCPECHRLAEALRPALELFQEAIGPEESRDLPGYWCEVAADRTQPLVSYATDPQPPRALARRWTRTSLGKNVSALSAWRLAAALALGVTLGSLLSARWRFDGFSAAPPVDRVAAAVPLSPQDYQSRLTLAEQKMLAGLPAACFGHQSGPAPRYSVSSAQVLASADLSNLNCCSECHNSNSDSVSSHATVTVSQSCQICHKNTSARSLD